MAIHKRAKVVDTKSPRSPIQRARAPEIRAPIQQGVEHAIQSDQEDDLDEEQGDEDTEQESPEHDENSSDASPTPSVSMSAPANIEASAPAPEPEGSDPIEHEFLLDLDVEKLTVFINEAVAIRARKVSVERASIIQKLKSQMQSYGLKQSDLFEEPEITTKRTRRPRTPKDPNAPASARAPAAIKYRGPNEGDTWTGRGRAPRWLSALEAEGHARTEYAV